MQLMLTHVACRCKPGLVAITLSILLSAKLICILSPKLYIKTPALAPGLRSSAAAMSTISEAITKDHQELATYYNEVINNPDNLDQQQRYGNQFVWELARHSVGEELIVYPAFEKHLGARGKEMAEKDRKEHSEVITLKRV